MPTHGSSTACCRKELGANQGFKIDQRLVYHFSPINEQIYKMQSIDDLTLLKERVRRVVAANVRLPAGDGLLADDASLYEAGMDSHGSVNLMIALEAELGIDFPNSLLKRSVFTSIASIANAVDPLLKR